MIVELADRPHRSINGSDRSFGLIFAAVFLLIGLRPVLSTRPPHLWGLILSAAFLLVAVLVPRALAPLNTAWMKLGDLLGRVVNPIVLGVLYFGVLTPIMFLQRILGKDPLQLKSDHDARSYWIPRNPPGPSPESFSHPY